MKVVLDVSGIQFHRTGIGRYIWEIVEEISTSRKNVQDFRLIKDGRWVDRIENISSLGSNRAFAKSVAEKLPAVANIYRALISQRASSNLKSFRNYIFHGPNYFLPKFEGRQIATVHDLSMFRFPEYHIASRVKFFQKQIPLSVERAEFLITDSEFIRKEIIQYFGYPEDKIRSIHLGVSAEYQPRTSAEVMIVINQFGLGYKGYSLCVATMEPRKNIIRLLDGYSRLPKQIKNRFPLVLVGGYGWKSEEIHQRIDAATREGWVRYLGYVAEADLPYLYSGAKCFLYPSLYEGFGLPVLEAMASGVPVLISNRASLPEIVLDAGIIVEPEDVSDITSGMQRLFEDDDWREFAIPRALDISKNYTWQNTANETVKVYQHVSELAA